MKTRVLLVGLVLIMSGCSTLSGGGLPGSIPELGNQCITWRAHETRYWPTLFLIDKKGNLRYVHIGEGAYGETEAAIQILLAETYP